MATTTINGLTSEATSAADTDNFVLQTSGNITKKISKLNLFSGFTVEARTLTINGITFDLSADRTWNVGDMILASAQSITGIKTFDNSTIKVKGSSTGVTTFTSANASAADYTITFPASTGTVALLSDIPGSSQPYDIGGFYIGTIPASEVLFYALFNRTVVFPTSLTASNGIAKVSATTQTDFDILKNGVSIGTMRFAAAATTASFISASGATFNAGDYIEIIAPGTPDATLATVTFLLAGTR